ncbi:hypothetical protein SEA_CHISANAKITSUNE_121 [Gordonia phage ChisanaKitsune]|uniref:Uncharacterized protein n=1 Tax=Gordonia phage ChisanaKitsune TaxID=2871538 RepID=A0AAE7XFC8_9CAUD|nr:hypothetical protein PQD15_gp121 [Gordonia phage ChisanaKitsune]QZE10877.1 hypothetical protein SEA_CHISANAKITSUNE_121 [Gordonia phage ChisanaKitsune]
MARLRNVGRQAAGDYDIISMRDLNAFGATLPQLYVQRILLNAANGVPQLDVNSRMQNAYLPTDISRTNLTASGKVKGATLEVTAGSTLAGVTTSGNMSVGGTLSSIGAITGPSLDVGAGQVNAATADIPEIISENFKAKATTLSSLTVPGQTSLSALNLSGSLSGQSISATALSSSGGITATGEVSAATIRSTTGSLIAEGPTSLQAVTVNGVLSTQAITATQQIRANGGLRMGVGQTITQVDASNNSVPVQFGNGAIINGPLTNVTSLSTSGTLTVGGLTSNGNVGITGTISSTAKGTFGDLQSNSNLQIYGTLTGVTDLTITGNLSVTTSGKSINALLINATDQANIGYANIADGAPVTNGHMKMAGTIIRQNNSRLERYSSVVSNWVPNMLMAYCQTTMSVSPTFEVPNNTTTKINMVTAEFNSASTVFQPNISGGIQVKMAGWYEVHGQFTITCLSNKQVACSIRVNDAVQSGSTREFRAGVFASEAGSSGWGYLSAQTTYGVLLNAGDYVTLHAYQNTGFSADVQKTGVWKPTLSIKWMGTN